MPSDRIVDANEHAFVVLDAYPVSPGHSLVVSRRHVADVFELTEREIGDMLRLIQSTRERIDQTHHADGYNLGINVGRYAGQTVMHVHIHVIPRYRDDTEDPRGGVRAVIPGRARYPRGEESREGTGTVNAEKRQALEAAGFVFEDAEEFLELTVEERRSVELRLAVSRALRTRREQQHLTQEQVAKKLKSSQSRVAKMEAGAADVSLDLMFRGLFVLGGSLDDLRLAP